MLLASQVSSVWTETSVRSVRLDCLVSPEVLESPGLRDRRALPVRRDRQALLVELGRRGREGRLEPEAGPDRVAPLDRKVRLVPQVRQGHLELSVLWEQREQREQQVFAEFRVLLEEPVSVDSRVILDKQVPSALRVLLETLVIQVHLEGLEHLELLDLLEKPAKEGIQELPV